MFNIFKKRKNKLIDLDYDFEGFLDEVCIEHNRKNEDIFGKWGIDGYNEWQFDRNSAEF